jgi:glycosyltransferase involved in cell wall biosynthesis
MKVNINSIENIEGINNPLMSDKSTDQPPKKVTDRTPLLSILCITYNHENYIAQAIDSFLMQETTFPVEIVIGEDCSKDGSLLIIKDYIKKHPRLIRLVNSESNVGYIENFRRTLKACKGKYIAICEGDDYWTDSKKIQVQVDFLEKNHDYVITYHDAYAMKDSKIIKIPQLPRGYQCDSSMHELICARPISTLTACFRYTNLHIPIEFNRAPILDLCIWSLLGNLGKGKYIKNIQPGVYRMHSDGIFSLQTKETKSQMTAQTYLILSEYYRKRNMTEIYKILLFRSASEIRHQMNKFDKIKLIIIMMDDLIGRPIFLFRRLIFGG